MGTAASSGKPIERSRRACTATIIAKASLGVLAAAFASGRVVSLLAAAFCLILAVVYAVRSRTQRPKLFLYASWLTACLISLLLGFVHFDLAFSCSSSFRAAVSREIVGLRDTHGRRLQAFACPFNKGQAIIKSTAASTPPLHTVYIVSLPCD